MSSFVKRWRAAAAVICLFTAFFVVAPRPASAIFGIGDVVIIAKLIAQLKELQRIYGTATRSFEMAKMQIERVKYMRRRDWLLKGVQYAQRADTKNRYGENYLWSLMTAGSWRMAPQAWADATTAVAPTVSFPDAIPGQSSDLAALATVEQTDSSSVSCLAAVGEYRANLQANNDSVARLQAAVIDSEDNATNSGTGQQNLANAQALAAASQARDAGILQACRVEQAAVAGKLQRDSIADALNRSAKRAAFLDNTEKVKEFLP